MFLFCFSNISTSLINQWISYKTKPKNPELRPADCNPIHSFTKKGRDKNTPHLLPVKFNLIWRHNSVENNLYAVKVRVILPRELTRSARVNLKNILVFIEEYGHAFITEKTGCSCEASSSSVLTQNGVTSRNARAAGRRESQWVTGHVDFVRHTTSVSLFEFSLLTVRVRVGSMERTFLENVFLFSLNMAGWLWGVVSFLPWYYLVGRKQYRPRNKVQARPVSQLPGAPYRCVEHFDSLVTTLYDGVTTLDQLFK